MGCSMTPYPTPFFFSELWEPILRGSWVLKTHFQQKDVHTPKSDLGEQEGREYDEGGEYGGGGIKRPIITSFEMYNTQA